MLLIDFEGIKIVEAVAEGEAATFMSGFLFTTDCEYPGVDKLTDADEAVEQPGVEGVNGYPGVGGPPGEFSSFLKQSQVS